jgi:hypothetical protein
MTFPRRRLEPVFGTVLLVEPFALEARTGNILSSGTSASVLSCRGSSRLPYGYGLA